MVRRDIKISVEIFDSLDDLNTSDKELCEAAATALENSHSPYSEFKVGSAVKLSSGKVVLGSNQENVAFPSGLCAERVALFHAGAYYPNDQIDSMAITAFTSKFLISSPVTPCGSCLQVMAEYEKKQGVEMAILLYCLNGQIWKGKGIRTFLPFVFFEERLK